MLAADTDLPALARATGAASFGLLTVANALHWMDAAAVFAAARQLLRPGGGIAVITHGRPWLGERDWTQALRGYLQDWFGPTPGACGTDEPTQRSRRHLLEKAGFADVAVVQHHFQAPLDPDYLLSHLHSALPPGQLAPDRRDEFAAGVRAALQPYTQRGPGALVEDVAVGVLMGRRRATNAPDGK